MNPLTAYQPNPQPIHPIWIGLFVVAVILMIASVLSMSSAVRFAFASLADRLRAFYGFARRQPLQFTVLILVVCGFVQYGATKSKPPVQENITVLELAQPVETPNGVDFSFSGKDGFDLSGKRVAIERSKLGAGVWQRIATVDGETASAHIDGFTLDETYQYRARVLEEGDE